MWPGISVQDIPLVQQLDVFTQIFCTVVEYFVLIDFDDVRVRSESIFISKKTLKGKQSKRNTVSLKGK